MEKVGDWKPSLGGRIALTPLAHTDTRNVFRVHRLAEEQDDPEGRVLHVAGGQHSGIVVRKMDPEDQESQKRTNEDLTLDFNVYMVDAASGLHKQENRSIKFWYDLSTSENEKHLRTREFFKTLLSDFPKDYLTFVKKLLKMFQEGFYTLKEVEIDMKLMDNRAVPPSIPELETSTVVEQVTANHVKEVLEHAYPNGMTAVSLADSLKIPVKEADEHLEELKERGLIIQLESGQWVRADTAADFEKAMVKNMPKVRRGDQPTVAIISALYVEKLAVDAVLDNKQTFVRYKTDGESNIYTLGNVGRLRVVSTKLSAVGGGRSASIAAGSVTTRLLGCFQDIEHVLVVGAGGGVAHFTSKHEHVRLGDVVVSTQPVDGAIIVDQGQQQGQYSYVHCEAIRRNRETGAFEGYLVKSWNPSDTTISKLALELKKEAPDDTHPEWRELKEKAQSELCQDGRLVESSFRRPPAESDVLTVSLGDGDMATVAHPDRRSFSRLHTGPVGAGRPSRDPDLRADFAQQYALKAFDVDFQTVIESILGNRIASWALIRGVADYGDGARNREWQPYAALQAAVVARMLVARLPVPNQESSSDH